jgi:hypothetical protein
VPLRTINSFTAEKAEVAEESFTRSRADQIENPRWGDLSEIHRVVTIL